VPSPYYAVQASSFLLLTPLPDWRGAAQPISPGLAIRPLDAAERTAIEFSDALLLHHSIDPPARAAQWICYEFENPHAAGDVRYRRRQEAAFKFLHHALYAVQILAPIGAPNLALLYQRCEDGLTLGSAQHRPPYRGSVWARLCDVPPSFASDVPVILERVREVFQKPVLRLQIPVWLLEQGLVAPDRHIRLLLWATGLDGVTRAGGVAAFAERLCALIGGDSEIFPPCASLPRPCYRVADVVEHLYLLRTEMAHGLPFHEQFRKTRGFLATNGQAVSPEFAAYRYDAVLEECSVFLLCKALREALLRPPTSE
jgi:hypothetical protein